MSNVVNHPVPPQRAKDLVVRAQDDGTLVLDRRTETAHYLPPEVARVWGACTGRNSLAEIASVAGTDEEIAASAVDQLLALDLLELPAGVDRRSFLRRGAVIGAGVFTVPVIESVVASPAWAAYGQITFIPVCTRAANSGMRFTIQVSGWLPGTYRVVLSNFRNAAGQPSVPLTSNMTGTFTVNAAGNGSFTSNATRPRPTGGTFPPSQGPWTVTVEIFGPPSTSNTPAPGSPFTEMFAGCP